MEIISAYQLKNGAKTKEDVKGFNSFTQPLQFLTLSEKDEDWAMHNLDWLEWQGVKQISYNARRLMKNYKLAKGTIDKSDYIPAEEEPDDIGELVDLLSSDSVNDSFADDAMELKFYPIIPNVLNVLVSEFAKRNTKVTYRSEGEYSYNEIMDAKMMELEEVLMEDAYSKLTQKMIAMGADPQSPEFQEQLDPNVLKRLPEIEEFYSKTYQTLGEQWATKQHAIDVERFRMDELEEIAFRDMLITDREFWHFRMMEDDYEVELWNPVLTFYHKSPEVRYISEGNWVGKVDLLTVSDALELYGPILTLEQQEQLEHLHPVRAGRMLLDDLPNDGSYYNPNQSHEDNLSPSLQMKRWMTHQEHQYNPDDIVDWIVGQSEQHGLLRDQQLLRVTTGYWKTQRRIGYLTSVGEGGETVVSIVDESYVPTNNPIYHSNTSSQRTAETLVFGDHIDWVWINQVYGGRKIGPNRPAFLSYDKDREEFCPIYVGIEGNKIGPIRYQFKGDDNLYGCKLPVEGKVFTERNTKSTALVDLMKSSQIGFNMTCNQITDIMIDEIGTAVVIDQNALPQKSLGEDWGKGNYAKAYQAMKDFNILPLDTSLQNTENALNFAHFQQIDLSQTGRLMSKISIAQFFKQMALEVVGFTPERLGQQIGQTETARGVEQAVAGSYAQTETYFIQHSDYLMPRVHQMRTDLAQYYHSKRPSVRLQSMVSPDERTFFEINGVDLLLIDINVFCTTNANTRAILEQMKQIASTNNTAGSSLLDIGGIMESSSMGQLNNTLRAMETKAQERAQMEHQQALELAEKESENRMREKAMENDHDAKIQESKNRANILIAEIRAAGFGATVDIDQNMQSDFKDAMDEIKQDSNYQQTFNLDKTKEDNKVQLGKRKLELEEKKINTAKEISDNQLKVARENTSKSEIEAKKRQKKSNEK